MGARILFRDSHGRDGAVDLDPSTPCYVGRALDCAIRTDDAMVSRKHSVVRMENGRYSVEDLGSSNGTLVNDQRVRKQQLSHNDVVRCGSLWLRYVEDGPLLPAGASPSMSPSPSLGSSPGSGRYGGSAVQSAVGPQGRFGAPGQYGGGDFGSGRTSPGSAGVYGGSAAQGVRMPASPAGGGPTGFGGQAPGLPPGVPPGGPGMPGSSPEPRKKGGTMRLDVGGAAAALDPGSSPRVPAQPMSPPSPPSPFGSPPQIPAQQSSPPGPFGSPPAMPGNPFGGPPPMPTDAGPFGGPPPMPTDAGARGEVGNPFDRPAPESSVVVDLGPPEEVQKAMRDLEDTRRKLDDLQTRFDNEVAEGKRMRAETAMLRDRIGELEDTIKDRDDQMRAHQRVAEELRDELTETRGELAGARHARDEHEQLMQAKEKQLGRVKDDISKLKEELEERGRQLAEVSKTKDEGWNKLNEQLAEIEHLREVINEQERMLEERKVGLISQEEVIKELRADKEETIKQIAKLRAERDELLTEHNRQLAQLSAIDEENKRLGRLMAEMQHGGGGSSAGAEHTAKLAAELKDARVEARKLESDRDRYQEMYARADADVQRLEDRVAKLEVELREANDRRQVAASSSDAVRESLTKAELARAKAAEEALAAAKQRDEAVAAADRARRDADRLRRRVEELEKQAPGAGGGEVDELRQENQGLSRQLKEARDRVSELARSMSSMEAELVAARADARAAETAPAPPVLATAQIVNEIKELAMRVYGDINDILSEIRNNLKLIGEELEARPGELSGDATRIISDTVTTLIANAEDAKGIVRGLRELVEFG